MQTDTDVQALLQSDKASDNGTHGKLVMSQQTLRKAYKMSEQEHEKLINAIKRKRVTEEDKERFCISDSGAGIYNMALDHVIEVIEEMFKGEE